MADIREFPTGATRDQDAHKIDPEGCLSPLVLQMFCEYMHKHRFQGDGTVRSTDNWQRGIPFDAYMKSMYRHFLTVWQHHRGWHQVAKEDLVDALMGLLFNVQGFTHELLRQMLEREHEKAGVRGGAIPGQGQLAAGTEHPEGGGAGS